MPGDVFYCNSHNLDMVDVFTKKPIQDTSVVAMRWAVCCCLDTVLHKACDMNNLVFFNSVVPHN